MTEEPPAADASAEAVTPVPTGPAVKRRSRRGLLVRLGVGLAMVLTLVGGPAAMAFGRSWWQPYERSTFGAKDPAMPAPAVGSGVVAPQQAPARPGRTGDAGSARNAGVRVQIQSVLTAQAAALLRGDENAFLAPVDPANQTLLDNLRQRFGVLRAMNIAGWTETLADDPAPVDGGWRANVRVGYCFVVLGCAPVAVPVPTRWAETSGAPQLVEFGTSGATSLGPRPWEVSDLNVAIGARTIVAAPPKYASRVPALLDAAEEAASVADRYARWAPPPGRYIVYLAGPDEWGTWYGVHQAEWVAGYAMPLTERDTEIVLNAQRVTGPEVVDTLRHEFAHVVTLANVHRDYSGQWWLVEGVAEYVRMVGRPLRDYELLAASRRYVRAGNATDLGSLAEPAAGASTEDASGRYGVAFLTVRRLAERFGEDATLRFFDRVVRQGTPQEDAAKAEFGGDWDDITDDCAKYVKRNLS